MIFHWLGCTPYFRRKGLPFGIQNVPNIVGCNNQIININQGVPLRKGGPNFSSKQLFHIPVKN
jgi:hypothetical protein